MKKIAFRFNATTDIGLGHAIRCMNLAKECRKRGYCCVFIVQQGQAQKVLAKSRVRHIAINKNLGIDDEAKALINILKKEECDILITDSYSIDNQYLKKVKGHLKLLIRTDDRIISKGPEDILINQSRRSKDSSINKGKLIGPKYVIINNDFIRVRKVRKIRKDPVRIVVSLGGSDMKKQTRKVVQALLKLENKFKIDVIAGQLNMDIGNIRKITNNRPNFKIIKSASSMAGYMLKADLGIFAGGTTLWEAACTGLPIVSMIIADNQKEQVNYLSKIKVLHRLGWYHKVKIKDVHDAVWALIRDHQKRSRMSINGKRIVDGKGKARVLDVIDRYYKDKIR